MTAPHDGVTPEPEQSGATTAAGLIASQTRRHSIVLAAALIVALAVLVAAAFVVTSTSGMKEVQRQQSEAAKIALSLSVNQLHAVALRNVPFSAELTLVRTVAGADSATARDLAIIEPMQHVLGCLDRQLIPHVMSQAHHDSQDENQHGHRREHLQKGKTPATGAIHETHDSRASHFMA